MTLKQNKMSTRVLNDIHNDLRQLIKIVTSYKV